MIPAVFNNAANEDLTNVNRKAHLKSDVDSGTRALHHTLGKGPMQAAPGDHEHEVGLVPLGGATVYFGDSDPDANFLILDGRELLRADYTDLLAVPGLSFANGPSGAAYFLLPNPTNRDLVGAGGDYTLGSTGGADTATLTTNEMPSHDHVANWSGADGTASSYYRRGDPAAATGANNTMIDNTGGGAAFSIKNRYLAVNFVMRVH